MQWLNAVPVPRVRMAVRKATILFPDVLDTHVYRTRKRSPTIAAIRPMASNTLVDSNQSETKTKKKTKQYNLCCKSDYVEFYYMHGIQFVSTYTRVDSWKTRILVVFQITTRVCQKKIMGFIFHSFKAFLCHKWRAWHQWNGIWKDDKANQQPIVGAGQGAGLKAPHHLPNWWRIVQDFLLIPSWISFHHVASLLFCNMLRLYYRALTAVMDGAVSGSIVREHSRCLAVYCELNRWQTQRADSRNWIS